MMYLKARLRSHLPHQNSNLNRWPIALVWSLINIPYLSYLMLESEKGWMDKMHPFLGMGKACMYTCMHMCTFM